MKTSVPILIAALALGLTACNDDSTDASPSTPPATTGAESSSGPSADDASWADESDPALRTQGCLEGEFVLDDDVWVRGIGDVLTASDLSGVQVDVTGRVTVTLEPDGTYVVAGEDQSTTSRGSSPGGQMLWVMTFDGTESGTWVADASVLTLTAGPGGRLAGDHELSIDGNPLPTDMLPVSGTPWSDTLTVTCDAGGFVTRPADDPQAPDVAFRRAR
ncbi:MAG: hypothetical protein P1U38_13260 [Aeromicrobium sp.]|uniref:hypothetical protein n=1 Tax=Aeromicrobium sp. TaxID=1871063 RepID=UPI0026217F5A|nr:hypothetical protein [Aeromicrobium sp.]MDF1705733.1 hypothetical protein [Aeromicrobium sp.]